MCVYIYIYLLLPDSYQVTLLYIYIYIYCYPTVIRLLIEILKYPLAIKRGNGKSYKCGISIDTFDCCLRFTVGQDQPQDVSAP